MATPVSQETKTDLKDVKPQAPAVPLLWRQLWIAGLLTGLVWCLVIFAPFSYMIYLAGVIPIGGGIYLGRKIQGRALVHGVIFSLIASATALVLGSILIFSVSAKPALNDPNQQVPTAQGNFLTLAMMVGMTLLPFPAYGTVMARRGQERTQAMRDELSARGGQLERPGRVVSIEDLESLPLPKFGSWVAQLFRNNNFKLKNYKFNKDVIDLYLERNETAELWLVRCTLSESLKPGQVQELYQDLRDNPEWHKGVIVTSLKVQDGARKSAKSRPNVEVLDGETLLEING